MKNNDPDELLVGSKCIVYPTSKDVIDIGDDLVVRLYAFCDSIDEGLLG